MTAATGREAADRLAFTNSLKQARARARRFMIIAGAVTVAVVALCAYLYSLVGDKGVPLLLGIFGVGAIMLWRVHRFSKWVDRH